MSNHIEELKAELEEELNIDDQVDDEELIKVAFEKKDDRSLQPRSSYM